MKAGSNKNYYNIIDWSGDPLTPHSPEEWDQEAKGKLFCRECRTLFKSVTEFDVPVSKHPKKHSLGCVLSSLIPYVSHELLEAIGWEEVCRWMKFGYLIDKKGVRVRGFYTFERLQTLYIRGSNPFPSTICFICKAVAHYPMASKQYLITDELSTDVSFYISSTDDFVINEEIYLRLKDLNLPNIKFRKLPLIDRDKAPADQVSYPVPKIQIPNPELHSPLPVPILVEKQKEPKNTMDTSYAKLIELTTHPAPGFVCQNANDSIQRFMAKIENRLHSPAKAGDLKKLDAMLPGNFLELKDFYRKHDGLVLYQDTLSETAGVALFKINEMKQGTEDMNSWLEMRDSDEENGFKIGTLIAIGEIPHSGNYFAVSKEPEHAGKIFLMEHETVSLELFAGSFGEFLLLITKAPADLLSNTLGCHARYSDGKTEIQWIPLSYAPDTENISK